jgi:MYXO-CTERM domain-containing protein
MVPASPRGTVYGLAGVGLVLAVLVSRRQRRR